MKLIYRKFVFSLSILIVLSGCSQSLDVKENSSKDVTVESSEGHGNRELSMLPMLLGTFVVIVAVTKYLDDEGICSATSRTSCNL